MYRLLGTLLVAAFLVVSVKSVSAQTTMANYTAYPPFINQTVPPLVMLVMSKDHRMFIKGYNDMQDLDSNVSTGVGGIETTYADYIDYYGYFDPKKCYTYNTGVTPNRFDPAAWAVASGGFRYTCTGQWSGNFLNWATMTRMDIVRRVLYGGKRGLDNSGSSTSVTTLRRTWLPQDAHSFAKAYQNAAGRPSVSQLTPNSWTSITFCNTNTALFDSQAQGRTLVANGYYPYAGSTNNKQCTQTFNNSGVAYPTAATYNVEVKICDPNYLEANCEEYKSGGVSWYKPAGLMQRMGLNRQGTPDNTTDDRVNMRFGLITGSYGLHISGGVLRSKMTTVNSEIDPSTGVVAAGSKIIKTIDNFMVRQYSNSSGWYDGDSGTTGNCGSAAPSSGAGGSKASGNLYQPVAGTNDDKCISWGNPIGEMFYEALRYFLGKATQTTTFQAATPDIGYKTSSPTSTQPFLAVDAWDDPYTTGGCPYCSKPFVLTLSDAFPSFDSDHLPGSNWAATVSPSDTGLNVQTLMAPIETNDGQGTAFIGEYKNPTSVYDEACTSKTGTFRYIRGLCPEEPTKQGAYYLASLAHYAKITDLRGALGADTTNTVKQNVTTYSVVTNSPFPILEYTINSKRVQLIPIFHDDCPPSTSPTYNQIPGVAGCNAGTSPPYHIGTSDGSKGELVDFQICDSNDESGNGYEYCYDVMWDDAEYGWDYDLDVRYRIYVDTNPSTALACITIPRPAGCSGTTGSGTAPTADTIRIRTKAIYASAGHTDFAGYLINGVSNTPPATGSPSAEGEYYMIRCGGAAGGSDCDTYDINSSTADGMGNSVSTKDFTVTGSTTDVLKDPFWYAAKYGGFEDKNGNNIPDNGSTSSPGPCTTTPGSFCEWDKDLDGVPDTYFYAANPLQLEARLAAAFAAILNRASSGTAASVLASSTTGEGALYQSFFFPVQFESTTGNEIKYSGYTQSLFVDAFGNLREDTNGDGRLIYTDDRIIVTRYDVAQTTTVADLYADTNGDGKADGGPVTTNVKLVDLKPIWEAGRQLALVNESNRRILTWIDKDNNNVVNTTNEVISFDNLGTHTADLTPYLNTDVTYTAQKIIQFIRGCDPWATGSTCTGISTFRDRRLTTKDDVGTPVLKVWKLGDPVYATPTIIGAPKERYDALYGDPTYSGFFRRWKDRRQVAYIGANDGMLHAFNVGRYNPGDDTGTASVQEHGWFTDGGALADGRLPKRGDENWAFIPQELLPHLRWLADPAYSHVYYVDLKPKITDVRIFTQEDACGGGTTPTAPGCKHPGGWGTILIGGFRMGGSCGNCSPTGNGAPMVLNKDFNYDGDTTDPGDTRSFLSSYFVLDITDPESDPVLLWSFSHTDLGLTTSYPAVLRVRGAGSKADPTGEKWFVAFGSGPTSYEATTSQHSKLFIVNLATGPSGAAKNDLVKIIDATAVVSDGAGGTVATANSKSFVGDLVTVDKDLDFRDDSIFAGQVVNDTRGGSFKPWRGLLIRLTTGCQGGASSCQLDPADWGIAGGSGRTPTQILDQFGNAGGVKQTLGPIATAPALVVDDQSNLWLFSGTGRYFSVGPSPADSSNTDTQYLVGVKDRLFSGTCSSQTSMTNCISPEAPARYLVDLSAVTVCVIGTTDCTAATQVSNVTQLNGGSASSYASLVSLVQSQDGWFTTLPTTGERMVSTPVVLGGIVLYPTFVPSSDLCVAAGNSYLYALYYKTGGPYSEPVIGTTAGGTQIARSMSLGQGLGTSVALHIGVQGSGAAGGGSQSGLTGCSQSSVGSLNCVNINPAGSVASRYLSWRDQRD